MTSTERPFAAASGPRRLDQALVELGLCASREQAKRLVLAGLVRVNGQLADKVGTRVRPDATMEVLGGARYVSRGGEKLEHGLKVLGVDPAGLVAIDVGASTGGFTDCLLQHGAARVYAVDVGRGQLAWKLRQDPRVVVMERTNARFLTPAAFPAPFAPADLVVADCSFISLRLILPATLGLLKTGGRVVALVKPQFEAGKADVDRGRGVITDPGIHQRVLAELRLFVDGLATARWVGETESPLLGPAGNKEFLALLEKT